jgi:hypothetical protein
MNTQKRGKQVRIRIGPTVSETESNIGSGRGPNVRIELDPKYVLEDELPPGGKSAAIALVIRVC